MRVCGGMCHVCMSTKAPGCDESGCALRALTRVCVSHPMPFTGRLDVHRVVKCAELVTFATSCAVESASRMGSDGHCMQL